jgi:hypothetical protein
VGVGVGGDGDADDQVRRQRREELRGRRMGVVSVQAGKVLCERSSQ